jgi:hypothetical protein
MEFLKWVEELPISTWIRESGAWYGYSLILTAHTVGLSILVGISFALDLRLLGFNSGSPLEPYRKFVPYLWIGFWMNAISGVLLLMADATTKLNTPVFYVKMGCIVLAMWNLSIISRRAFEQDKLPANAKSLAWISIILWVGATTAGRLMAYLGPDPLAL